MIDEQFKYRWAILIIDKKQAERIVVEYYDDNTIFVCGSELQYGKSNFVELGEFVR